MAFDGYRIDEPIDRRVVFKSLLRRWIVNPRFALAVFGILSLAYMSVPGLYMDAVNPDYLAFVPSKPGGFIPAWLYPDNILFPDFRHPLLASLYGGATPGYIAMVFFGIFGHGLASLRLLHICYGLAILSLVYLLLRSSTGRLGLAVVAILILGTDPSFIFAWRTQYYLQIFPLLFFIPALFLLSRTLIQQRDESKVMWGRFLLAGFLAGFSAWSYFIYAFYTGAILAVLVFLLWSRRTVMWKAALCFLLGAALGESPFIYAHLSIPLQVGIAGYIEDLRYLQSGYGVLNGQADTIFQRFSHVLDLWFSVSGGLPLERVMYGEEMSRMMDADFLARRTPNYGPWVIAAFLGVIAVLAAALKFSSAARARVLQSPKGRRSVYLLIMIVAVMIAHFIFGMVMGRPLKYQHYAMLLILMDIGAFTALAIILSICSPVWRIRWPLAGICGFVILVNVVHTYGIYEHLQKTGGRAEYTDVINRVGEYVQELPQDAIVAFPQWGYWMGALIIAGADREVWEATTVDALIKRINESPFRHRNFYILVSANDPTALDRIAAATGLTLTGTRVFSDRAAVPQAIVGSFKGGPN
ncbi:glycosyltransferase family 39 protein [Nitrospirillum sp. BR 11752]|uniref:glycosyltransferase family 39 protein n=1 Tax=Nitrospirillum sp. BR 11752 TaxID=3104293 RepID=UPI002EBC0C08|nr:glycosyltransferase family 39 protein [Nitrospirillum sp. BR 11752]